MKHYQRFTLSLEWNSLMASWQHCSLSIPLVAIYSLRYRLTGGREFQRLLQLPRWPVCRKMKLHLWCRKTCAWKRDYAKMERAGIFKILEEGDIQVPCSAAAFCSNQWLFTSMVLIWRSGRASNPSGWSSGISKEPRGRNSAHLEREVTGNKLDWNLCSTRMVVNTNRFLLRMP